LADSVGHYPVIPAETRIQFFTSGAAHGRRVKEMAGTATLQVLLEISVDQGGVRGSPLLGTRYSKRQELRPIGS
jgi:hypothetical protein